MDLRENGVDNCKLLMHWLFVDFVIPRLSKCMLINNTWFYPYEFMLVRLPLEQKARGNEFF